MGVFMMKEEGVSDITLRSNGHPYINPIICTECEITSTSKFMEMNPQQALDHVQLVHVKRGHKVYEPGLENLVGIASDFKDWKIEQLKGLLSQ